MKPGIKTTEFWLVLIANVLQAALAEMEKISSPWASVGIGLLTGLYLLARLALKNKQEPAAAPSTNLSPRMVSGESPEQVLLVPPHETRGLNNSHPNPPES